MSDPIRQAVRQADSAVCLYYVRVAGPRSAKRESPRICRLENKPNQKKDRPRHQFTSGGTNCNVHLLILYMSIMHYLLSKRIIDCWFRFNDTEFLAKYVSRISQINLYQNSTFSFTKSATFLFFHFVFFFF